MMVKALMFSGKSIVDSKLILYQEINMSKDYIIDYGTYKEKPHQLKNVSSAQSRSLISAVSTTMRSYEV